MRNGYRVLLVAFMVFSIAGCGGGGGDSGAVDGDGDGFDITVDCNDQDVDTYPGATELCDGLDNDCDLTVDNGLTLVPFYLELVSQRLMLMDLDLSSCLK